LLLTWLRQHALSKTPVIIHENVTGFDRNILEENMGSAYEIVHFEVRTMRCLLHEPGIEYKRQQHVRKIRKTNMGKMKEREGEKNNTDIYTKTTMEISYVDM
jgi:hypothetical protein